MERCDCHQLCRKLRNELPLDQFCVSTFPCTCKSKEKLPHQSKHSLEGSTLFLIQNQEVIFEKLLQIEKKLDYEIFARSRN